MADNLLSTGGQQGNSSLLSILSSADVANPLAAINAGTTAASNVMDLRQKQANQAIGGILQQATDANGNVDFQKAQALAAQAGPVVQSGMQSMLKNNSDLRGQQIQQTGSLYNMIGAASASLMNDPSDANIERIRSSLTAAGAPQGALTELDRIKGIPDPNARRTEAYNHNLAAMDAQYRLAVGGYPTPVQTQMPQGFVTTQTRPASPYAPAVTVQTPGGVRAGVAPGDTQTYMFQPTDADGKPAGAPYQVTAPKGTVFPSMQGTQITPVPDTGGSGSAGGFPPGYTGRTPPNASLANPNKPAPAAMPPAQATPPTAASPAVTSPATAPTATPPATTPPAISKPPGEGVATGVPVGTPEAIQADVGQFKQDQANLPKWQTADQNLGHAYEALKLTTSGRSTEATHNMYSFLLAQGALPPGMQDSVVNYDLFKKYTERVIADLGNAAGTDQGRQLAAMSNAGTSFSTAANMEIMRNDIAKNRQQMAIAMLEDQSGTGVGYGSRKANLASTTDPRGFAWNLYTPSEQQKILAEVAKDKTADAKLHRAIGIADTLHLGVTPGQTPAGPSVPATPPAVVPTGPRAMLQTPNAVATNYAAAPANALAG